MSMASEAEVAGVIAQVTERTPVEVRFGVVESITLSGTYPTVGVTLGRDDGLYPVQLRYIGAYAPRIGDTVYVLQFGGDPVVLGSLRGGPAGAGTPPGTILQFAGTTAPPGYLACDGATYNRVDYPDLFTAIGTVWGAPSGSTFQVPDLRARMLVGAGLSGWTAGLLAAHGQTHAHAAVAGNTGAQTADHAHSSVANGGGVTGGTADLHGHSLAHSHAAAGTGIPAAGVTCIVKT